MIKGSISMNFKFEEARTKFWLQNLGGWHPIITFYNTGKNLFCVERQRPDAFFPEGLDWYWIKFSEFNPFLNPVNGQRKRADLEINHFGHSKGVVSIQITGVRNKGSSYLQIPPGYMLYVVGLHDKTIEGGIKSLSMFHQFRPLPLKHFAQALVRP